MRFFAHARREGLARARRSDLRGARERLPPLSVRQEPEARPRTRLPTKYRRNYVASLSAADAWLATFFDELERRPAFRDSIVVLVGDHSFPADEHGIHFNGLGSYEEAFHTGFALRWKGHVQPRASPTRRVAARHRTHDPGSPPAPDEDALHGHVALRRRR